MRGENVPRRRRRRQWRPDAVAHKDPPGHDLREIEGYSLPSLAEERRRAQAMTRGRQAEPAFDRGDDSSDRRRLDLTRLGMRPGGVRNLQFRATGRPGRSVQVLGQSA